MGGGISRKDAEILQVGEDGMLLLTESYRAKYGEYMPEYADKNPAVGRETEYLIKENWDVIMKGSSSFNSVLHNTPMEYFYYTYYGKLFSVAPGMRSIFQSSVAAQGKALGGMVGALTKILQTDNIFQAVQDLAKKHESHGVALSHYEVVGGILLDSLEAVSGNSWNDSVRQAYLSTYSFILYLMVPTLMHFKPRESAKTMPGRLNKKFEVGPGIHKLTITGTRRLRYYPGDSVMLAINSSDNKDVYRHYAITNLAGPDGSSTVDIYVKACSDSAKWLVSRDDDTVIPMYWIESRLNLKVDDPDNIPRLILLLSAGMGICPMIAMAKGLHSIRDKLTERCDVAFVHSAATTSELLERREIELLKETWPPFKAQYIVSQVKDSEPWNGLVGRVDEEKLLRMVPDIADRHVYMSGSMKFLSEMSKLLDEMGVIEDNIQKYSFDNTEYCSETQMLG